MRIWGVLGVSTALAACAINPAEPVSINLTDDRLRVQMSDGSRCFGVRPEGDPYTWTGTLTDCPWPFAYRVEIDPGTNPLRFVLEEFTTSVGLDTLISPVARVEVIDANGRTRIFGSPDPFNQTDDDNRAPLNTLRR